jgi:hypothetical protein
MTSHHNQPLSQPLTITCQFDLATTLLLDAVIEGAGLLGGPAGPTDAVSIVVCPDLDSQIACSRDTVAKPGAPGAATFVQTHAGRRGTILGFSTELAAVEHDGLRATARAVMVVAPDGRWRAAVLGLFADRVVDLGEIEDTWDTTRPSITAAFLAAQSWLRENADAAAAELALCLRADGASRAPMFVTGLER